MAYQRATRRKASPMRPDTLVTHSGGFHADELLSSVVLTRLFPEAKLIRTRDTDLITPAEGRVIYDVGGDYDPERFIFDHHQREAPLRDDGAPYSSFGLIWKHFGRDYLRALSVPDSHLDKVHGSVDGRFVLPVDLADNGALDPTEAGPMGALTLPALLETLTPVFDQSSPTALDAAFMRALDVARHFLEARVAQSAAKLRAMDLARDAVIKAGDSRILELPMGMPFRSAVTEAGADHLLFVITPREDSWTLGGIRAHDTGFELRADLPEAWAGLSGAELEAACGVTGATFCHKARFIAAAKTREAIVQMAEIAVTEAERLHMAIEAERQSDA